MTPTIHIEDLRIVSEANLREHWRAKHTRKKKQQAYVLAMLASSKKPPLPVNVTLRRIGPKLLDSDNAAGACKHVQDAIASWLGVDDGNRSMVQWNYEQVAVGTKAKDKCYALQIVFSPHPAGAKA
jgi:hypothetical protein